MSTKVGLILSGGAFRGAFQVPVIRYLMEESGEEYDEIYGTSVGSINGSMAAMYKFEKLQRIWDNIDGLSGFLSSRWYWPFNGLYSMKPLREKIDKHVKLSDFKTTFNAGVVSFTSGEYYNLGNTNLSTNLELRDAVQASSCMAGIMIPSYIMINGERHLGCDGGYRNIFPIPDIDGFDKLDVVACTPLDRMSMRDEVFHKKDVISLLARGIEVFEDEVFDKDLAELKTKLKPGGVMRIFHPSENPGDPLDASRETINARTEAGKRATNNPTIFIKN